MPPCGTIGIDLSRAAALPLVQIPKATGPGSIHIAVPNMPGLLGLTSYSQAVLVPYPNQERLSNIVRAAVIQ